jgi:quercetin dioxygenase-like cupin family protein
MTADGLSVPTQLSELIDYQADSVVSRVVLKNATGNVTVFAFDEGEGLSEHTTPHDALVVILDGTARITVGGESHVAQAGQALLLPADIPHALHAPQPFSSRVT